MKDTFSWMVNRQTYSDYYDKRSLDFNSIRCSYASINKLNPSDAIEMDNKCVALCLIK